MTYSNDYAIIISSDGGAEMEIYIYIDWDNCDVLSKQRYDEIIDNQVKKLKNKPKIFEDYLSKYYYLEDLFNFTDEDKNNTLEKYKEYLEQLACKKNVKNLMKK